MSVLNWILGMLLDGRFAKLHAFIIAPWLKGRGWFSFDKMYTERIYFRPPQSL